MVFPFFDRFLLSVFYRFSQRQCYKNDVFLFCLARRFFIVFVSRALMCVWGVVEVLLLQFCSTAGLQPFFIRFLYVFNTFFTRVFSCSHCEAPRLGWAPAVFNTFFNSVCRFGWPFFTTFFNSFFVFRFFIVFLKRLRKKLLKNGKTVFYGN